MSRFVYTRNVLTKQINNKINYQINKLHTWDSQWPLVVFFVRRSNTLKSGRNCMELLPAMFVMSYNRLQQYTEWKLLIAMRQSSSLYLCRKCCTLIEKVFKLRRQLQVFENTIVERLKCSTVVKRKESVDVAEEGK